jgi:hypothetical protein
MSETPEKKLIIEELPIESENEIGEERKRKLKRINYVLRVIFNDSVPIDEKITESREKIAENLCLPPDLLLGKDRPTWQRITLVLKKGLGEILDEYNEKLSAIPDNVTYLDGQIGVFEKQKQELELLIENITTFDEYLSVEDEIADTQPKINETTPDHRLIGKKIVSLKPIVREFRGSVANFSSIIDRQDQDGYTQQQINDLNSYYSNIYPLFIGSLEEDLESYEDKKEFTRTTLDIYFKFGNFIKQLIKVQSILLEMSLPALYPFAEKYLQNAIQNAKEHLETIENPTLKEKDSVNIIVHNYETINELNDFFDKILAPEEDQLPLDLGRSVRSTSYPKGKTGQSVEFKGAEPEDDQISLELPE